MFLILVLGVVLTVALVILIAMPHRVRGQADATNELFGTTADQLRPATLRLDDAATQTRHRRPRRSE